MALNFTLMNSEEIEKLDLSTLSDEELNELEDFILNEERVFANKSQAIKIL